MRREINVVISFLAMALFTASPAPAFADEARSYEQLSPNGKYLFVMLDKSPDKAGRVDTLKTRYRHSGLYKASDVKKSLWRVNWYSSRVHVSSDGMHLVRVGRSHVGAINKKPNMAQLAVAFYKNGNLIKKYNIEDLLKPDKLSRAAGSGFQWQKRVAFDDASGRLVIRLVTAQEDTFDIKSGKLIMMKFTSQRKGRR